MAHDDQVPGKSNQGEQDGNQEAYADYLLEDGLQDATTTSIPVVQREDLKDTRRLSVEDMRRIAEDE